MLVYVSEKCEGHSRTQKAWKECLRTLFDSVSTQEEQPAPRYPRGANFRL